MTYQRNKHGQDKIRCILLPYLKKKNDLRQKHSVKAFVFSYVINY